MAEGYRQLDLEARCTIARLHEAGQSLRQIAAAMDRSPSTISREMNRNGSNKRKAYRPAHAQEKAAARRWSGSRLERDEALRETVLERLGAGCSPEQVAGRLAREEGRRVISHESIYRFIHAQIRRTQDGAWRHYLPHARAKRGWRGKPGGSPASFIKARKSLTERPADASDRNQPGHWEADYMLFARYGHNLLIAHERSSRLTFIVNPPDRKAETTVKALRKLLKPIPSQLRKTITFDNGTEFAQHFQLATIGLDTFFCDPHAPWQKGGIENAIGRLRRYLPRNTNLDRLTPKHLKALVKTYNNTPRKCLDFLTPAEAFSNLPLHFKCESTSPRPRG
jgi:transposase, IS30 family